MKKNVYLLLMFFALRSYGQDPDSLKFPNPDTSVNKIESTTTGLDKRLQVYKIKPWLDIPLTIALDAWSIHGMNVIYNRDQVSDDELLVLNKNNINRFDRPIADNYSPQAATLSDSSRFSE